MPAQKPTKTGIPNMTELDLANSLDLHIASNNFVTIIDDYAQYIALNYAWKISKQAGDPITAEAEFFKKICKSGYYFSDTEDGVRSPNWSNTQYDIIDLNSHLKPNEIWVRTKNNLPEKLIDNSGGGEPRIFFKALNLHLDTERIVEYVPALAVKYQTINAFLLAGEQWVKDENGFPKIVISDGSTYYVALNVDNEERNVSVPGASYTTLDQSITDRIDVLATKYEYGFGAEQMDDEFLWHWYQKFKTAHYLVREEYKKLIGSDFTIDYFEDFNDSIGALGRLFENPDVVSVPPTDITFKMSRQDGGTTIPKTVPANVFDKLDDDIKFILLDSSLTVNKLFRRNAVRAIEELATPSQSHGTNLMTDYLHYRRMSEHYGDVTSIVSDTLGVSFRVLGYATSSLNKQGTASPVITKIIEHQSMQVDAMQRKIVNLTKNISTSDLLEAKTDDLEYQG